MKSAPAPAKGLLIFHPMSPFRKKPPTHPHNSLHPSVQTRHPKSQAWLCPWPWEGLPRQGRSDGHRVLPPAQGKRPSLARCPPPARFFPAEHLQHSIKEKGHRFSRKHHISSLFQPKSIFGEHVPSGSTQTQSCRTQSQFSSLHGIRHFRPPLLHVC